MSCDDYSVEYHLTPSGWKTGASYFYGKPQKEIQPPSDRLLTVVQDAVQTSRWSTEEVSWRTEWTAPDTPPEVLKKLFAEYGEHPS
jgi:hypothetical protein